MFLLPSRATLSWSPGVCSPRGVFCVKYASYVSDAACHIAAAGFAEESGSGNGSEKFEIQNSKELLYPVYNVYIVRIDLVRSGCNRATGGALVQSTGPGLGHRQPNSYQCSFTTYGRCALCSPNNTSTCTLAPTGRTESEVNKLWSNVERQHCGGVRSHRRHNLRN